MTDTKNILVLSLFLGFLTYFVTLGAGGFVDISGTDNLKDLEPPQRTDINLTDFKRKNNTFIETFENGDPDFGEYETGTTWDGTGNNGKIFYDVRGYDSLRVDATPCNYAFGVFLQSEIEYTVYSENGSAIPALTDRLICGEDSNINLNQRSTSFWENVDSAFIQFTTTNEDWHIYTLEGQTGESSGFLDKLRVLTSAFILNTGTEWILALVVLPLTAVSIFLLLKYASDYIPIPGTG